MSGRKCDSVRGGECDSVRGGECDPRSRDMEESRAKERFHKIDHRIRSVLQHSKQLPRVSNTAWPILLLWVINYVFLKTLIRAQKA